MTIDRHHLAAISIIGCLLDVLGSLYLAYDLLGGRHGPLRTLTRAVTYGLIFGIGYGLPLGLAFGIASGAAHGVTLAFEFTRASKAEDHYALRYEALFSAIRGLGFAIGASYIYGLEFGAVFGALSTAGQIIAYSRGIRPGIDYQPRRAPRISRRQFAAASVRTVGYAVAGYISAVVAGREQAFSFGIEAGLTIGLVTAGSNFITPFIEWITETVPDRHLGVFGIVLILTGFGFQSVQYWIVLLDVPLR